MRIEFENGDEEIINFDRVDRILIPKDADFVVFYFPNEKVTYNESAMKKTSWNKLGVALSTRV